MKMVYDVNIIMTNVFQWSILVLRIFSKQRYGLMLQNSCFFKFYFMLHVHCVCHVWRKALCARKAFSFFSFTHESWSLTIRSSCIFTAHLCYELQCILQPFIFLTALLCRKASTFLHPVLNSKSKSLRSHQLWLVFALFKILFILCTNAHSCNTSSDGTILPDESVTGMQKDCNSFIISNPCMKAK